MIPKKIILFVTSFLLFACNEVSKNDAEHENLKGYTCYFFFISDCPASRNNLPKMVNLNNTFSKNGLKIIGVVSDPKVNEPHLNKTLDEFNVNFEIQIDSNLKIARLHNAKVTPEVFLYNQKKELIYNGKVDDYYYKLGKHKKQITRRYLFEVINQSLIKKPIETSQTEAIGCKINFDNY